MEHRICPGVNRTPHGSVAVRSNNGAGEFTGEGFTDIVGYHPDDGSIWLGRNNGSQFKFRKYATVSPAAGWSFVAGEFTGDSYADIAAYHPSDGSVWVGANTGSTFSWNRYAMLIPTAGWSFVAGEFTGDSYADLVGYHPDDGSI